MIVWITGASSGLGEETARQYVASGHTVIAMARSEDKLKALQQSCAELDGKLAYYVADVADREVLGQACSLMVADHGMPDVAILNAGTHWPTPARDFDLAGHRRLVEVNYLGVLNSLDCILTAFQSRGRGQVAIVASLAGYRGLPMASGYGASKAALINFAESIKEELAQDGIDIRLVNPGFVKTPLTDLNDFEMPFLMPVDAAARRMIKGLAGSAFEITFPTRFAWIMKLFRVLPDWLFLALTKRMIN